MLQNDKLLITLILSVITSAIFTFAFINIAYCDSTTYDSSFQYVTTDDGVFYTNYTINSDTDKFLICMTSEYYDVGFDTFGYGAVTVSERPFTGSIHVTSTDISYNINSVSRSFTWHGLNYSYYYCINTRLLPRIKNLTPGNYGAVADFNKFNLTDNLTYYDYIYLVYKGVINDDNFNYPEGYYIPDNVQIVESSDTMSSAYDSNKAITCEIAIPNTSHASYLNVKNVKVGYNNILAYLKYNFSFSSIFAKKYQFYDVDIYPTFNTQEDNIQLLQDNVKYEKFFCKLPSFDIDVLRIPLDVAIHNVNKSDNVEEISMPYNNQGNKNIAFEQYKRNNTNLSDYTYPNLPCSKTITYYCTLSDANLNKESDVFTVTAMFDDEGKLSSVYYSGGVQPDGTEVKPQAYSVEQNYNNLISKNDSEQGNQNNEDLTDDAEEEGKTLVTNTNDWNDINIDNVGFKGTLTSLFDMITETLPFLRTIMFFVPSWVFALMALVLATVVIMRILGR